MEQINKFQSFRGHYKAEVCVIWCFDHRVADVLNFTLAAYQSYDLITLAGGAKGLAQEGPDCDFLVKQIETSIQLHDTKKILISNHSDCGAYGGLKAFDNDSEKEREFHEGELKKAKSFLQSRFPGVKIEALYVDFETIYEV
jgi:carbonic anhydrase